MNFTTFILRRSRFSRTSSAASKPIGRIAKVAALSIVALGTSASGQSSETFNSYLPKLLAQSRQAGVSQATLDRVAPTISLSESALRIERRARGGGGGPNRRIPPFTGSDEQRAIIGKRAKGQSKYLQLRPIFDRIKRDTGVPAGVILAIYGKESNFGSYTGNFDIPSVLASLAYEGRRRELFSGEFIAAMKMIDRGVPRSRLTGSFAGAMGKPQFLPSVYLRLAADGNGDGEADIWNSEADAMVSIANYLSNAGWRRGESWGMAVSVPSSLDRDAVANHTVPQRCPRVFARHSEWKTVAEWRALGVLPKSAKRLDDGVLTTLLEPDFEGKTAYLLTGNYRAILDYNCSNFYALSVGLLADEIAG
ncbi:lytic murein transglycosylase [Alterisphingorhabdus coralli]|uniref:Lytic murein transglycosylase n=1 Tax=Alterisphingorhabdus coralli TaxID=3071408 RepID=A0AA97F6J2_9SPHN|nr:lytic murein transglycosylase [Parasphingorhabdus sp. SCSIO 66989]WOE74022.1 lytic murein transglycosylase [Parasphingorhabdus sp. SCSIO 66989]